jgi:hypothetical protein
MSQLLSAQRGQGKGKSCTKEGMERVKVSGLENRTREPMTFSIISQQLAEFFASG